MNMIMSSRRRRMKPAFKGGGHLINTTCSSTTVKSLLVLVDHHQNYQDEDDEDLHVDLDDDDEAESFSCNPPRGLFSDDDSDLYEYDHNNHEIIEAAASTAGNYIDIALPPPPTITTTTTSTPADHVFDDEFQFSVSFDSSSPAVSFPTFPVSHAQVHPPTTTVAAPTTSAGGVSQEDGDDWVPTAAKSVYHSSSSSTQTISTTSGGEDVTLIAAVVNMLLPTPFNSHSSTSSEFAGSNDIFGRQQLPTQRPIIPNKSNWELIRTSLNKSSTAKYGGVRKLVVKFRSIKRMIWSSLTAASSSSAKSRQLQAMDSFRKKRLDDPLKMTEVPRRTIYQKLLQIKPFQRRRLLQENNFRQVQGRMTTTNNDNKAFRQMRNGDEEKSSSRATKLDAICSKVVEAVSNVTRGKNINRSDPIGPKSCPASIKSSPIHDPSNRTYSRHNSIQAAIAHCKTSFAQ